MCRSVGQPSRRVARSAVRALLTILAGIVPLAGAGAAVPAPSVELLAAPAGEVNASALASGALDAQFSPLDAAGARARSGVSWLRLRAPAPAAGQGTPALVVDAPRGTDVRTFDARDSLVPLAHIADLPQYRAAQSSIFLLPQVQPASGAIYARVDTGAGHLDAVQFSVATVEQALAHGTLHARMIALAVGALLALSLAALLIWFVLADPIFLLYASFISLQALYVAYLSGQGFEWPWLAWAAPLGSHAWNVPVALSGASACLFVREIADLRHFSPRIHAAFGWLAIGFVALAAMNALKRFGFAGAVSAIGNLMFLGVAIFTLVVAFLAWRRGIRAAGWFLLAWGLLEAATIATAVQLLLARSDGAERLLFYGLPLSMVIAAVLVALGVADRLRDQRIALSEAERHAQIDALTGVLNRRSLIERLEAACSRARARDLPIALLFIDLDHFKAINDTRGHAAGDACLRAIVSPIQAELRQSDVIGRYGGEEFVVILSSADTAAARPIAERIRERVAGIRVEGFGEPLGLTCSIGVAGSDHLGVWGEELIARADAAVYAAKNAGRNRVQTAAAVAAGMPA
jgi:diguanylate cyclase (GGDEF)-like protein